ncbi:MAG: CoA pyrophosphatase [Candidatus Kapaibacterium sp.]
MEIFADYLQRRLNSNLPGINSHLKMVPKIKGKNIREMKADPSARQSAVMVLLVDKPDIEIIFTLRSRKLRNHSGQISFPGGRLDKGENALEAALRETHEEIGIYFDRINVIGKLSELYVRPSNSIIVPYIGIINDFDKLVLNHDEVEECFTVPISYFTDSDRLLVSHEIIEGYDVEYPSWNIGKNVKLWGATSMILQELIDIYEEWLNLTQENFNVV